MIEVDNHEKVNGALLRGTDSKGNGINVGRGRCAAYAMNAALACEPSCTIVVHVLRSSSTCNAPCALHRPSRNEKEDKSSPVLASCKYRVITIFNSHALSPLSVTVDVVQVCALLR